VLTRVAGGLWLLGERSSNPPGVESANAFA